MMVMITIEMLINIQIKINNSQTNGGGIKFLFNFFKLFKSGNNMKTNIV